ncbi:MAG: Rrf2 family transcriptional regulator [Variovorax sp.]|nr:MAG: Rrf2 family transcriptional regulator [Variovorax sp.]
MRLTTKGRMAVVAMIDVALHGRTGPVALAVIARRQRISVSYLELMFSDLRRHGLVASTRGPGGGYTIGRDAAAISVADIVYAVDSASAEPGQRGFDLVAPDDQRCLTPDLWSSLSQRVVEFLDSISLQKLVEEQLANGVKVAPHEASPKRALLPATRVQPTRPKAPNSVFELGKFQTG